MELLSTVLPEYLESPVKTRRLTDPHGTAVAKVVVTCLYACLSRCGKFLILLNSTLNTMIEDGEVCQLASLGQIVRYLQRDIVK